MASNIALSSAKMVSTMMSRMKIGEVSKTIEYDTKLQDFFKMFGQNVDLENLEVFSRQTLDHLFLNQYGHISQRANLLFSTMLY